MQTNHKRLRRRAEIGNTPLRVQSAEKIETEDNNRLHRRLEKWGVWTIPLALLFVGSAVWLWNRNTAMSAIAEDVRCPREFSQFTLPSCSVDLWREFDRLGLTDGTDCGQNNCTQCLPPNSHSARDNELHRVWFTETYLGGKAHRQQTLRDLLLRNGLRPNSNSKEQEPVILATFNWGFRYLFVNWVCSLDFNALSHLRRHSLIVVLDAKSERLAIEQGFRAVLNLESVVDMSLLSVSEAASRNFGGGSHTKLTSLQMILLSDLIEMGFSTLMIDIDTVFVNDPLQHIREHLHPRIDIWTGLAPRWDPKGFANTGVILMRSNCKTRAFMLNLVRHIFLVRLHSDQSTFNLWLFWRPFRQIHFELLERELWIGGHDVVLNKTTPADMARYDELILFHAHSTRDHFDKIHKFHQIGHWYLSPQKCAHSFDRALLPDLKDRHGNEDRSSAYLAFHGLVRDSRGGSK